MLTRSIALAVLLFATPPAAAELPEAARQMIEAAIEAGDRAKAQAVVEIARATFPEDVAQIDELWQAFEAEQGQLAAARATAQEAAIRSAGVFDQWSGEGQIGAFQSSGNADSLGVTAALRLQREGIDWTHRLRGTVDYQRNRGRTSREQFLALYEPRYQIHERLFAYGLAQYERDRLQGFTGRYAVSGGLGYHVIDKDDLDLSIKAGPAYRVTQTTSGETASRLAGLFGIDFDWRISDGIKLTQDANATAETGGEALLIVDSSNTSLTAITGLEASIADQVTARVSWTFEYDDNPPPGAVSTDTATRFTLIYGF